MGLSLKTIQKLQLLHKAHAVLVTPWFIQVTPPLHDLLCLPITFWVQFKGLIITFKVLHSTGPSYLQDCISLRVSTCHARLDRVGEFQISSLKYWHLMGPQSLLGWLPQPFGRGSLFLKIWRIPTLLAFQKVVKTWLFPQSIGCDSVVRDLALEGKCIFVFNDALRIVVSK